MRTQFTKCTKNKIKLQLFDEIFWFFGVQCFTVVDAANTLVTIAHSTNERCS